jgi:hypothetical protein
MVPRPKCVKTLENYCLQVSFENGETKIYDMSALLAKPFYSKLKNRNLFNTVKVSDITLEWATGEDLCPDELYYNSKKIQNQEYPVEGTS